MNKSNVVKIVVVISVISFTLHLLNKNSLLTVSYPHFQNTTDMLTVSYPHFQNTTDMEALNQLLIFSENEGTRLYLIDPGVVSMFNDSTTANIGERNMITLGMNGTSQTKMNLFDHLQEKGFKVYCSEVDTAVNLTLFLQSQNHLPAHFLIYHPSTNFLIHIVVFYKRYRNFIWCDRLRIEDLIQKRLSKQKNLTWLNTEILKKLSFGRVPLSFKNITTTMGILGNTRLLIPENRDQFLKDYNEPEFIECNYTRAEKYYKEYKMPREPTEWALKALKMLDKTAEALDPLGIPFSLGEGTLLGWYRQCGITSFTTDLDILVFREDYSDDILTNLKKVGFNHMFTFGTVADGLEYSVNFTGIKMDLFIVYKEKDVFWLGAIDGNRKLRFTLPKFTYCWSELLGVRVRVPCESTAYIKKVYGKNWFKPLESFSWAIDSANFKVVGTV